MSARPRSLTYLWLIGFWEGKWNIGLLPWNVQRDEDGTLFTAEMCAGVQYGRRWLVPRFASLEMGISMAVSWRD